MSRITDQLEQEYIGGLLTERAGYLQSGRKDRASQVDAELKRLGYTGSKEATVDPHQEVLETAATESKTEKATVRRKATRRKAAKPRQATPAEEKAIAQTVEAEAKAPEPAHEPVGPD